MVAPYIRPGPQSQQPTCETRDGSRGFASSLLEDDARNAIWTSSLVLINVGQHTSRPALTYECEVAHDSWRFPYDCFHRCERQGCRLRKVSTNRLAFDSGCNTQVPLSLRSGGIAEVFARRWSRHRFKHHHCFEFREIFSILCFSLVTYFAYPDAITSLHSWHAVW